MRIAKLLGPHSTLLGQSSHSEPAVRIAARPRGLQRRVGAMALKPTRRDATSALSSSLWWSRCRRSVLRDLPLTCGIAGHRKSPTFVQFDCHPWVPFTGDESRHVSYSKRTHAKLPRHRDCSCRYPCCRSACRPTRSRNLWSNWCCPNPGACAPHAQTELCLHTDSELPVQPQYDNCRKRYSGHVDEYGQHSAYRYQTFRRWDSSSW